MKRKFLIISLLLTASLFTLFLSSCDIKSPIEGLEVRLNTISRTSQVSVEFVDAATGQLISTPVNISFSGTNKDNVISTDNESLTALKSENGLALFAIKDELTPDMTEPFKVILVCSANGYLSTSKAINVITTGVSKFTIIMTNVEGSLPKGVVSNQVTSGSTSSSGTTNDIEVSSGDDPSSGASAKISIPSGTKLLDADGNVLSGEIKTRVTYFNPVDDQSLGAFPGGFNVNVQRTDNSMDDGNFVTAGFVAIDMSVGNAQVENFSKDIDIDLEIPSGFVNPLNGEQLKAGDKIPVWSYNEVTGEWKEEGEVTVPAGKSANGNHRVSFKASHLSYWNLDWFYGDYCNTGVTLNFVPNSGCFNRIKVVLRNKTTGQLVTSWSENVVFSSDPSQTIMYAPRIGAITVEVYEFVDWWTNGQLLASVDVDDICANETVTINFDPADLIEVNVSLRAKCTEGDQTKSVSLNGFPVWAREYGADEWDWMYLGEIKRGKIKVCLKNNGQYYFITYYNDKWYYSENYNNGQPYTIDKTYVEYDIIDEPEICDDL